uniref:Uncharacterized protein n=1 Tax=Timema douglasi TaxID=61478 RepID=A0A7R8ZE17_TIMDO|nr:unnamed protein product [Timema douglasi]
MGLVLSGLIYHMSMQEVGSMNRLLLVCGTK